MARAAQLSKPNLLYYFPSKEAVYQALLGSLISGAGLTKKTGTAAPADPWCRDGEASNNFATYRRAGSSDSYLMALGDAGRSASVYPAMVLPNMPTTGGFSVALNDVDGGTANYPSFDALPRPEQVMKLLATGKAVTRTTLGSNGRMNVNINAGAVR